MRNAAILTLRVPGANFGLVLSCSPHVVSSFFSRPSLRLALAAFVSLLAQHYLNVQAPVLANFRPAPAKGPVPLQRAPPLVRRLLARSRMAAGGRRPFVAHRRAPVGAGGAAPRPMGSHVSRFRLTS